MGTLRLTQEAYDSRVLGIADRFTDLTHKTLVMKTEGDPDVRRRENEAMMLLNILDALKHYDIDAEILTDQEIEYMHELATIVIENCPI